MRGEPHAGSAWRRGTALVVSAGLLALAGAASAQTQPKPAERSPLSTGDQQQPQQGRSIIGTVKTVAPQGLVIEEVKGDGTKGKEWAFALEAGTRTRSGRAGEQIEAGELRAGDRVAVIYADRSGKIVAESITRLDGTQR